YEGRGAGAGPTASAVVADILDIARGHRAATFAVPADGLQPAQTVDMGRHRGPYYVRLTVVDRPGVFADIAALFRDHNESMESVLQRGRAPGEEVPVVMTLHDSLEADVVRMLDAMGRLDSVVETPRMIRIEPFA
ncbi:MAG: homoserine dehydrogenase, partial [Rhodospirillaceae bacterium]